MWNKLARNHVFYKFRKKIIRAFMYAYTSRRSRIFLKRGPLSCQVPSRRDSVGGVVAEFFRGLQEPTRFSGGGVVAEFFRGLQEPTRFSGGGSSRIFPWSPRADAIQWGG